MRLRASFWVVIVLILAGGAACNQNERASNNSQVAPATTPNTPTAGNSQSQAPKPPETIHADGVRRITTVELRDLLANNEVVVVDVRTETAYAQGHITGARLIPVERVLAESRSLPKDKLIVTYCS